MKPSEAPGSGECGDEKCLFSPQLCSGLVLATAAQAQDQAAAPQAPAAPTDVKGIGDWTVRCFPVNSPSPCEMYFEGDDKNSRQRILGVSIAYIPSADRHLIQIAVPLGVSIPKGLVVQTDQFTSSPLHYRRCDRAGCYVEMVIDKDTLQTLIHSSQRHDQDRGRQWQGISLEPVAERFQRRP